MLTLKALTQLGLRTGLHTEYQQQLNNQVFKIVANKGVNHFKGRPRSRDFIMSVVYLPYEQTRPDNTIHAHAHKKNHTYTLARVSALARPHHLNTTHTHTTHILVRHGHERAACGFEACFESAQASQHGCVPELQVL